MHPACKAKAMNRASRSMGELLLVATLSLSGQHVAARRQLMGEEK